MIKIKEGTSPTYKDQPVGLNQPARQGIKVSIVTLEELQRSAAQVGESV